MFDCYSEHSEFFFSECACVIHWITSSCTSFHFCSEDIELYVCWLRELQRDTKSPRITFCDGVIFLLLYYKFSFLSCPDPILQFLLSTVQDPKLSSVSALAIESLCMACHSQMTKYFDVLAQVTTSYDALFFKLVIDRTLQFQL